MGGGHRVRARGAGPDPRQGLARPPRHRHRPLARISHRGSSRDRADGRHDGHSQRREPEAYWTYGERFEPRGRPSGRPDPRSQQKLGEKCGLTLLVVLCVPALLAACATGGARPAIGSSQAVEGIKVAYDGRSVTGNRTHRFHLALALGKESMRLEVRPPVGGPRLVVTADGRQLLALDLANRRAELWTSQPAGVTRLIGAALGAGDLQSLLEGRSPCPGHPVDDFVAGTCAFGGGLYRPVGPADEIEGAVLLDPAGAQLLSLEYPSPRPVEGAWRKAVVLRRPADGSTLELTLDSGPTRAVLDPAIFSTERPAGFETGAVLGAEGLSAAVGADAEGSR